MIKSIGKILIKINILISNPFPFRFIIKKFLQKFKIGNYEKRVKIGAVERAHYGYCVYNAAKLAQKLGYKKISVLEFGVAGGNGLKNLEYHAQQNSKLFKIDIDIYGFDTGRGLPEPLDYRDLPYHFKKSFFDMNISKLQKYLKKAKLILGDIKNTSKNFFEKYNPAPIGAIFYDFDFYSSTRIALKMLEANEKYYLPRIFCYFDDTLGTEIELHNDYTGERLAINEFNQYHDNIKLGIPYYLITKRIVEPWYHQIWICHFFNHSRYNKFISMENQQLPYQQ